MNKKSFILPVVAALILAGCTMGKSTKKKKKSSSVEISSKSDDPKPGTSNTAGTSTTTAPAPTSGTTAPAPTSATTPAPTSASTTTAPTPGTSSTTTIPPTPTTSVIPPVTGWSASELQVFTDHFHGIVPPYTSVGLDLESEESEEGHYTIYSNEITETQIDEYFDAADSSWTVKTEGSGEDAYEYLYKASSDGTGHVEISAYYDFDDDDNVIYFLGFEWFDDGGEVPPEDFNWDSVSSVGSYFDMTPGSHTATIDFSTEYNTLKAGFPYVENNTPVTGSYIGNLKGVSCGCFCGSYSGSGYLMMKNKDRTAMGAAFIGNYDSLGNITSIEIQRGSSASTKVGYYVYFGNAPVTSQGGMASGTLVTADQCTSLKEVTGSGAYFCVTTSDTSANGQLAKLVIHYTIS